MNNNKENNMLNTYFIDELNRVCLKCPIEDLYNDKDKIKELCDTCPVLDVLVHLL